MITNFFFRFQELFYYDKFLCTVTSCLDSLGFFVTAGYHGHTCVPCRLVASCHYLFVSFYVSILILCWLSRIAYGGSCRTELCTAQLCFVYLLLSFLWLSYFLSILLFATEYSFVLVQFCQWMFYRIVQLEIWGRVLTMAAYSCYPGPLLKAWILS